MKIVEITYRYEDNAGLARERPADAEDAQRRMDDGNRAFADLFAAALAAHTLQREMGGATDSMRVAYGVYLLADRTVWAPRCDSEAVIGLTSPRRRRTQRPLSRSATPCSARNESLHCLLREWRDPAAHHGSIAWSVLRKPEAQRREQTEIKDRKKSNNDSAGSSKDLAHGLHMTC